MDCTFSSIKFLLKNHCQSIYFPHELIEYVLKSMKHIQNYLLWLVRKEAIIRDNCYLFGTCSVQIDKLSLKIPHIYKAKDRGCREHRGSLWKDKIYFALFPDSNVTLLRWRNSIRVFGFTYCKCDLLRPTFSKLQFMITV